MKSDMSKPMGGMVKTSGHKTNHPIATASSGAKESTGKSHGEDVALGEGLEYGSVHKAHSKMSVKDAKHDGPATQKASRGHQMRVENGMADPDGDRDDV